MTLHWHIAPSSVIDFLNDTLYWAYALQIAYIENVGILDLSNESNTIFLEKLIFRVKILTFKFGCSQTLNPCVEKSNQCCQKSHGPKIFHPMALP